jgi:methylmalonyl-CoA/ethylmalonyl-CoA epimerase
MADAILGGTPIVQVALVVGDIETKARAWAETLGLPMPEIIVFNPIDFPNAEYHGQPTAAQAKLAFFQVGALELELIEPVDGPSIWQEHLATHGDGLHHLAFTIEGMDEKVAGLAAHHMPLIMRGDAPTCRYAYVDGTSQLGLILELFDLNERQRGHGGQATG